MGGIKHTSIRISSGKSTEMAFLQLASSLNLHSTATRRASASSLLALLFDRVRRVCVRACICFLLILHEDAGSFV